MKHKRIFAIGGGGWMMNERDSALDNFVLNLVERDNPNVCLLATACGDAPHIVERFYNSDFSKKANASDVGFFRGKAHWEKHLMSQDIIYVGGGNTRTMLAIWREWGVDRVLRDAYENGVVLTGMSAGALCWFDYGLTDSNPGELKPLRGLGWLNGSFCPHFSQELGRREYFETLVASGGLPKNGYGVDDGVGLYFENGKLMQVIKSVQENSFYQFT